MIKRTILLSLIGLLFVTKASPQLLRNFTTFKRQTAFMEEPALPAGDRILQANFDEAPFPPENWQVQSRNEEVTWQRMQIPEHPFSNIKGESKASAVCPWALTSQEEWLITPLLDASQYQSLYATFYGGFSKTYLDFANLHLLARHQDSTKWKQVWNAGNDTLSVEAWRWRYQEIPLFAYAGEKFRLAWYYEGKKGDLTAIDAVKIIAGGPARGTDIIRFSIPGQTEPAIIDTVNHTVQVNVANGTNLANITPEMEISPGAKTQPPKNEAQNFSLDAAFTYTIFAADSTVAPQKWKVYVTMENVNTKAHILDFSIPNQIGEAEIDTTEHTVSAEVAYGTDLDSIAPEITISAGAEITPPSGTPQSFTPGIPFTYTVSPQAPDAEDIDWEVTITVQNYLNDIISFALEEQTEPTEIDSADHQVFVEISNEADFTRLAPSITVSPGATVEPDSGEVISVTENEPFYYTVTAANGDEQVWEVYIYKQIETLLLQEFDASAGIPERWTVNTTNTAATWTFQQMPELSFDSINAYNHYSALCPWSINASDEMLISPQVTLPGDASISMVFYAGFSRHWLDSATLTLEVRTPGEASGETLWNAQTDTSSGDEWRWRMVWIELDAYTGTTKQFVWRYKGKFGDLAGVDDIYIAETTALEREFFNPTLKEQKKGTRPAMPVVYPNPASHRVFFSQPVTQVHLYGLHGSMMRQKSGQPIHSLSLEGIPEGIYILKFNRNGQHLTKKIIKTR